MHLISRSPCIQLPRILCHPLACLVVMTGFMAGCSPIGSSSTATPATPASGSGLHDDATLQTPDLFAPGVVSTSHYELNAALTLDGKTVYFTVSPPNRRLNQYTIMVSHYRDGAWSPAEVAPFSGQYSDADPLVSPDGQRVYYISRRPHSGKPAGRDYDLFYVESVAPGADGVSQWSEPRPLGPAINTENDEYYVSVTRSGTVYYSAVYDGGMGGSDIYRSRWQNGAHTAPERLPAPVNSKGSEFDPFVAPDESYLIFASRRPDIAPTFDLYISFQRDGAWTEPRNLGERVNSDGFEFCPIVSPDGQYFFFTSEKIPDRESPQTALSVAEVRFRHDRIHNGLGNVYRVPVAEIAAMKPPSEP